MPARPSRRTVLAAAGLLPGTLASACTLSAGSGKDPGAEATEPINPDLALLDEVTRANDRTIRLYQATLRKHPDLRPSIRPIMRAHRQHAKALGKAQPEGTTQAAPRSRQPPPAVPPEPQAALRLLGKHERAQVRAQQERAGRAASGQFAQLLASLGASAAQHHFLLTRAAQS